MHKNTHTSAYLHKQIEVKDHSTNTEVESASPGLRDKMLPGALQVLHPASAPAPATQSLPFYEGAKNKTNTMEWT